MDRFRQLLLSHVVFEFRPEASRAEPSLQARPPGCRIVVSASALLLKCWPQPWRPPVFLLLKTGCTSIAHLPNYLHGPSTGLLISELRICGSKASALGHCHVEICFHLGSSYELLYSSHSKERIVHKHIFCTDPIYFLTFLTRSFNFQCDPTQSEL